MKTYEISDTIKSLLKAFQSNLHTILIARVTKVNESTINCLPVVNREVQGKSVSLPEFCDVPIVTMQGGTSYTQYPIAIDDYCLLFACERAFDAWYNGQDNVSPVSSRMHNYSDCIALVGVQPFKSAIEIPELITVKGDRDITGNSFINGNILLTGDFTVSGNSVTITAETVTINSDNIIINGNLRVNGTISAENFTGINGDPLETDVDIISNGISLQHHKHGGVETGTGDTGEPI